MFFLKYSLYYLFWPRTFKEEPGHFSSQDPLSFHHPPFLGPRVSTINLSLCLYIYVFISHKLPKVSWYTWYITSVHPDYTIILDWKQHNFQFFCIKIQLHVRTGKNRWIIFAYQPTIFLHLSPFKGAWIISVFKYMNKIHSLSWDLYRKLSWETGKKVHSGMRFPTFRSWLSGAWQLCQPHSGTSLVKWNY